MSLILNHMEENHKETQRLIGLDYEQLQKLIQNLEQFHNEKQDLLESNQTRIIAGGGGIGNLNYRVTVHRINSDK